MKAKGLKLFVALLLFIAAFLFLPALRARVLMKAASVYEQQSGKMTYDCVIPLNQLNWFPVMIHYDASEAYNERYGTHLKLMILYTFGDFKGNASEIYDMASPYYSSFMGAYVVEGLNEDTSADLDCVQKIPVYDYENLILRDLGDEHYSGAFQYEVTNAKETEYLGTKGWQQLDISIETHGLWHEKRTFMRHYLQFGEPHSHGDEGETSSFEKTRLEGRIYYKRLDSASLVILYAITSDLDLLNQTDAQLLSKSKILPAN